MTDSPKLPTTTNQEAGAISKVLSVLENTGVAAVEALIIADVPWLGFIGIKQIWEALFSWIAGYFLTAIQNGVTFAVIDHEVTVEEFHISQALVTLIEAEKSGDPSAIQAAIKNYANAQSALMHDDGSLPH